MSWPGLNNPLVMPALVAGIHVLRKSKTWMAGTSPAMTHASVTYILTAAYSAGIGVAGAVGAVAACDGGVGPFSGFSSIEIKNAMPNDSTSAQARNTNLKA